MIPNVISPKHRVVYFASVGFVAACCHLFVVLLFVNLIMPKPLVANVLAFLVTINVSYVGHRHLTFRQLSDNTTLQFRRFLLVAASSAMLNEGLYFLLLKWTNIHYLVSLVFVIGLVSVYTFIISRLWACR